MTVEEKRKAIEEYCDTRDDTCRTCPLYETSESCYEDFDVIDRNYKIVFGTEENAPEYPEDTEHSVEPAEDPVYRPSHYTDGKIEVIDYIEDKNLGFCLGNAIKYISRAGKKDPSKEIEDLKKAKWYIERRIKELEEVGNECIQTVTGYAR